MYEARQEWFVVLWAVVAHVGCVYAVCLNRVQSETRGLTAKITYHVSRRS